MNTASIISEGDYIIVKRNNFIKLHQYTSKNSLMLGKDKVDLSCIAGKPEWTLYRMIPKKNSKREYMLEVSSKADNVENSVMKDVPSGLDNRNIINDNKSQLLSSEEINDMRESGISSCGIVSALIENSTTFKNKTEYSQVKYLKKKMKKYHEFITIRKPTVRMLAEILFNKDQFKILGLRYDSLSQIISAANIQPDGVYMLYENGTQGLVGAALLNHLSGSSGTVINLSSLNHPQKQAILAMNFSQDKLNCLLTVKISSLFDQLLQGERKLCNEDVKNNQLNDSISLKLIDESYQKEESSEISSSIISKHTLNPKKSCEEFSCENKSEKLIILSSDNVQIKTEKDFESDDSEKSCPKIKSESLGQTFYLNKDGSEEFSRGSKSKELIILCNENVQIKNEKDSESVDGERSCPKRKSDSLEGKTFYPSKRPKWSDDLDKVCKILNERKTDGLIIACKEYPLELLNACLKYIKKSRPLIVYSVFREPLVDLYVELKKKKNILGLHLTETWLREYQVLEGRTHPMVSMSPSGGYLLTATVV